ncbi:MAG TPA: ATP-binding protein [Hanamia sp.]|jgi:signal transduction histidine kinase|nr:ATP-binding protein [Hanamia sp.]
MTFIILITILIISFLRKSLRMKEAMPGWNQTLWYFFSADIVMLVLHVAYSGSDIVTQWIALLILAALMYIINENDEFKQARFLMTAVVPYLIVSAVIYLTKAINFDFYDKWKTWFDSAETFAIIWGFGAWFTTRRQRRELAKVRQKALEEEENNKVISAMKAQLEVQVAERTKELQQQKEELEVALKELKATQSQLIQSEKMASLGELTAGIAHEIQNPLNFVNNFSEVSNELVDEMKEELASGNTAMAIEISNDLKQNLEKILHHGKRADGIVKGMLQHSRSSSGQKEPTDINALADEYLRLAYHGLRAKDKSFNAEMKTDFDESIGKINIVPQDVGRLILNLLTNAFYAVTEKKKKLNSDFQPTVSVATKKSGNRVFITVSDNGNGIPADLQKKIFQPFFTTKPTGEGTGLGLSLSYDIAQAHGGEIKMKTEEGVGTAFTIELPGG